MDVSCEQITAWRDGANGFFRWVEDVQPRIPSSRGGYEVFTPADFQRRELRRALKRGRDGSWRYITIVFCWPRRHSKTICNALIVLWRFFNWTSQNICVLANTERQVRSTAYKLCESIILNTPLLLEAIGRENVQKYHIKHPALQSTITAMPANESGAYGQKISVAWTTELHAASDDSVLQVLASSVGDSNDGWVLIDSTTDGVGGPLDRLETLANLPKEEGGDPTIFFSRIEYADLAEAKRLSPPWIRKDWLDSRAVQTLPAVFASQHLNKRGSAQDALFESNDIEACRTDYHAPVLPSQLGSLLDGRKYVVGGGLDRAYGFSKHGDKTIWTTIAKAARDDEEPEYWVLNQKAISFSSGRGIKKAIQADQEQYGLENTVLESYNSQDIGAWCGDSKIPYEVINATAPAQLALFTELHRIVADGRLHFPVGFEDLTAEMRTFMIDTISKTPTFGHAKGFHDDRVYSLAWAMWALRDNELAAYELRNIICDSRSRNQKQCYLRAGNLILPCSESCEAHHRVDTMYLQFRRRRVDKELTLPEFFHHKVKHSGVRIYQGM